MVKDHAFIYMAGFVETVLITNFDKGRIWAKL